MPPAVVLKISELSYSHVFVTWEYLREEYNQITDYFQVKIREPGGDFVTTDRLTSGANSYNVTDIKSETEFELFVSAETPYGTRNSEPSTVTTLGEILFYKLQELSNQNFESKPYRIENS